MLKQNLVAKKVEDYWVAISGTILTNVLGSIFTIHHWMDTLATIRQQRPDFKHGVLYVFANIKTMVLDVCWLAIWLDTKALLHVSVQRQGPWDGTNQACC